MSSPPPPKTDSKPGSKIPPMPMQDDTAAAQPAGSNKRKGAGKRFFSAYAQVRRPHDRPGGRLTLRALQTWIGMSPLWLMGEAIVPGQKVGGTFKKGVRKLGGSAEELLDVLGVSKFVPPFILSDPPACSRG